MHNHSKDTECTFCKSRKDFIFPEEIIQNIHNVVLFVGAGISTENKLVWPTTFYEEICEELGLDKNKNIPFSKVMTLFTQKTGSKRELIIRIKNRLDNISSWPDLYKAATQFHRELALIPCIKDIVTTNWDNFFEKESKAQPFVTSADMIFQDCPGKKVFKIHGTINNLDSIVATENDYRNSYKKSKENLIGAALRHFLANKIMVFIGYSFLDEDFRKIYTHITNEMGEFRQQAWVVTLDKANDSKWKKMGFLPIYTDGTYFLEVLRENLERHCLLKTANLPAVVKFLFKIKSAHFKTSRTLPLRKYPEVLYCLSYQDGIIHALTILLSKAQGGDSLCPKSLSGSVDFYTGLKRDYRKRYYDHAYIQGFIYGLQSFTILATNPKDEKKLPRLAYYNEPTGEVFTSRIQFKNSLNKHKTHPAVKLALKQTPINGWDKGIIPQHRPRL